MPACSANITRADSSSPELRLFVLNPDKEKAIISIADDNGGYFYSDRIKEPYLSRSFDFTGVADGTYKAEISCGRQRIGKDFTIQTQMCR